MNEYVDTAFNYFLYVVQNKPVLLALSIIGIVLLICVIFLNIRINRLTKGKSGTSLEDIIVSLETRVGQLESHAQTTERALENVDGRLAHSVRGVALTHFDPFQNAGGQQSFVAALVNEGGNGIVLSGIHSRDGVRVYAKEVKTFTSERELSDEENQVIKQARQSLS
ncbi:MAG: DUF4446 family protein [Patescibacteria group bacterium UBA2163]